MPLSFLKSKPKIPPIERVRELNSKGLSETEIIDILQKEGYSPAEIDIALSQLLKESLEKTTKIEETSNKEVEKTKDINVAQNLPLMQQTYPQDTHQSYPYGSYTMEDYISYIDYLIQNRVSEISNQIKVMEAKYNELEKRLQEVVAGFKETENKNLNINKEIFDGIFRVENKIKELQSKIDSIESILKEILPLLIDSVRSLLNLMKK